MNPDLVREHKNCSFSKVEICIKPLKDPLNKKNQLLLLSSTNFIEIAFQMNPDLAKELQICYFKKKCIKPIKYLTKILYY
jgi:hypothetical protein